MHCSGLRRVETLGAQVLPSSEQMDTQIWRCSSPTRYLHVRIYLAPYSRLLASGQVPIPLAADRVRSDRVRVRSWGCPALAGSTRLVGAQTGISAFGATGTGTFRITFYLPLTTGPTSRSWKRDMRERKPAKRHYIRLQLCVCTRE